MSSVEISFGSTIDRNGPLDFAYPASTQIIAVTGSNQRSTAAATASGQTVAITAWGGPVKIAIGVAGSVDATSDANARIVPDGATRAFGGVSLGHVVAVVDA